MLAKKLSRIWPEWEMDSLLGEGSFGKVYRLERKKQGNFEFSAVKIISVPRDGSRLQAMREEGLSEEGAKIYLRSLADDYIKRIKLTRGLKGCANIVNIDDYKVIERLDGTGFDILIKMEYLTSLREYIRGNTLTEDEIIILGKDILNTLLLCTQLKITHLGIKPENIFISKSGEFKLSDFAAVYEPEAASSLGDETLPKNIFKAPEVINNRRIDNRADIYSLGMVLYYLLNNNKPPAFENRDKGDSLPPPANASGQMAEIILKACALNSNDRFKTPDLFRQALSGIRPKVVTKQSAQTVPNTASEPVAPAHGERAEQAEQTVKDHPLDTNIRYETKPQEFIAPALDAVKQLRGKLPALSRIIKQAVKDHSPYDTIKRQGVSLLPVWQKWRKAIIIGAITCFVLIFAISMSGRRGSDISAEDEASVTAQADSQDTQVVSDDVNEPIVAPPKSIPTDNEIKPPEPEPEQQTEDKTVEEDLTEPVLAQDEETSVTPQQEQEQEQEPVPAEQPAPPRRNTPAVSEYTVTFMGYDNNVLKTETVKKGERANPPPPPARANYTFSGWDEDYGSINSNLTITAQYYRNKYTVTFLSGDGTTLKTETVESGKSATPPTPPWRNGYNFDGWDKPIDNITGDLTVTAQYSVIRYTVLFMDYDGTIIESVSVMRGATPVAPSVSRRRGYTFTGWDIPFKNVLNDLVVTAQYEPND